MKKWPKPVLLIILFIIIESPLAEKSLQNILYRKSTETRKLMIHIAQKLPQNKTNSPSLVLISSDHFLTNFTIPNNLTYNNTSQNNTNSSPLVLSSTEQFLANLSTIPDNLTYMNPPQNNINSSTLGVTSTEQFSTKLSTIRSVPDKLTYMNPPQNNTNSSTLVVTSTEQLLADLSTIPDNLTYMNPPQNNTNSSPFVLTSSKQFLTNLSTIPDSLTYVNLPQNNINSSSLVLTSTEQLLINLTIAKKLTYTNPPRKKTNSSPLVLISTEQLLTNLTIPNNLTYVQHKLLRTWKILIPSRISNSLPQTVKAMQEAGLVWLNLKSHIKHQVQGPDTKRMEHCPYSISEKKSSRLRFRNDSSFYLNLPCGMVSGSSLTIIGTPGKHYGSFKIELIGSALPGETDPPVVLQYIVRSLGNKGRGDPVIVQNTWTPTDEWGQEVRCPSDQGFTYEEKVEGLEMCKINADRQEKEILSDKEMNAYNITLKSLYMKKKTKEPKRNFPFKQGFLAISTLRIGDEGIHMVVDGKHVTSFPYHSNLESWLISNVRISGDIKLLSVIGSGLPTSEVESITDLEMLKAPQIASQTSVDLFIGVFSTTNNFRRRMAVRRTWMQYEDVRSGRVVVRFFVGLHKNGLVNQELWREAETYEDIQILPFVDYYDLITWKSIAICIYGTDAISARYVMKTDDDSFVRVDSILSSLKETNITNGLLYGHLNDDTSPHRSNESKWYITEEEWEEDKYPTWANGPGYIVSQDIAKLVHKQHKRGALKMFKLEDVAMGIWMNDMKNNEGVDVHYVNEGNINVGGCEQNYVIAHYQKPRDMHCLWKKLLKYQTPLCCK